jgi:hypothetical protein
MTDNQDTVVRVPAPIALQNLIRANNTLLKQYQAKLLQEVSEANDEIMYLLNLNPQDGWKLDMESMCYLREKTETELVADDISDPEYGTIS